MLNGQKERKSGCGKRSVGKRTKGGKRKSRKKNFPPSPFSFPSPSPPPTLYPVPEKDLISVNSQEESKCCRMIFIFYRPATGHKRLFKGFFLLLFSRSRFPSPLHPSGIPYPPFFFIDLFLKIFLFNFIYVVKS